MNIVKLKKLMEVDLNKLRKKLINKTLCEHYFKTLINRDSKKKC